MCRPRLWLRRSSKSPSTENIGRVRQAVMPLSKPLPQETKIPVISTTGSGPKRGIKHPWVMRCSNNPAPSPGTAMTRVTISLRLRSGPSTTSSTLAMVQWLAARLNFMKWLSVTGYQAPASPGCDHGFPDGSGQTRFHRSCSTAFQAPTVRSLATTSTSSGSQRLSVCRTIRKTESYHNRSEALSGHRSVFVDQP